MVSKNRHFETLFHSAHYIEVSKPRLDHHAVRTLGNIHRHFAQSLLGIGRVHLIGFLIAFQDIARTHSIAKRAIKGAGIFGRIAHDLDIGVAAHLQRHADRLHPPVHHIGRAKNVAARLCLIERLINQHRDAVIIGDIARIIDQAVLPMAGVRIERDIGQHANAVPASILHRANGPANQIVGIERFGAVRAAFVRRGIGENRDDWNAEGDRLFRAAHQQINRPARDAGQCANRFLYPFAFGDE